MKRLFTICVVLLAFSFKSSAQDSEKSYKKVRIGLGLEGALPMGGLKTAYTYGGGATFRVAVALNEKSAVTATTGAIAFVPKDLSGIDLKAQINIPIKAGYKQMLTEKVYALGEAGTTMVKSYVVDPSTGKTISANGSSFTYSAGVGAHFLRLDTSLRYEGYQGAGFLGLRLGFNF
ncbi:MAG TPA: hypothetical protein VF602_01820 [Pedobacter sp.]|jgi:hypothetical protein